MQAKVREPEEERPRVQRFQILRGEHQVVVQSLDRLSHINRVSRWSSRWSPYLPDRPTIASNHSDYKTTSDERATPSNFNYIRCKISSRELANEFARVTHNRY